MFAFWIDKEGNFYLPEIDLEVLPLYFLIDSKELTTLGQKLNLFYQLSKTSEINLEHIKRYLVNGYIPSQIRRVFL